MSDSTIPETINIQAVANQILSVTLDGQSCTINLFQKSTGMYLTLTVGTTVICSSVLVLDKSLIVDSGYRGFNGNLMMFDTQGSDMAAYTGLNDRFLLCYFTEDQLTEIKNG